MLYITSQSKRTVIFIIILYIIAYIIFILFLDYRLLEETTRHVESYARDLSKHYTTSKELPIVSNYL